MKKALKRSLSLLLALSILFTMFSITVSAKSYTITLAGGYRGIDANQVNGVLNEKLASIEGDTYTDENGVVYTIDKEKNTITFTTDDSGAFIFPEYFFDMVGYTQYAWVTRNSSNSGTKKYAGDSGSVKKNTTYYGGYEQITYDVNFLPGADGVGDSINYTGKVYNSTQILEGAIFTRPDYVQVGWATVDGSNNVEYNLNSEFTVTDNVQFYPVWEPVFYDVVKTADGIDFGSVCIDYCLGEKSFVITNNSNIALSLNTPILTAYYVNVSDTTIAANGGAITVSIEPKLNLEIGSYDETLYFDFGVEEANLSIPVSFTVNDHMFVEYYSNNDATYTCDGTETALCDYGCGCTDVRNEAGSMKVYSADNNTALGIQSDYFKTVRFTAYGSGMDDEDLYVGKRFRPVAWSVEGTDFHGVFSDASDSYNEADYAVEYSHADSDTGTYTLSITFIEESLNVDAGIWEPTGVEDVKTFEYFLGACEGYFEYEILDDGIEITGYTSQVADVIIPAEIDGVPVTAIGVSAFSGNENVVSVTIPKSVTTIGEGAFANCTNLKSIIFSGDIETIGENAFVDCTSLEYVIFSETEIEDIAKYFSFDDATITSTNSSVFVGTGDMVTVNGSDFTLEFICIVKSDVNGDGVCDALDAWQVGLVSNGHETLDGVYAMAADSNADDIVDINDYQAIVNKAVS